VRLRDLRRTTVSLQEPVGDDEGGAELGHLLADAETAAPDARLESTMLQDGIHAVMATLTRRERAVIETRYGLGGEEAATVSEAARRLRLRPREVRHLEALVLRKLRATPEVARLAAA
jgi:DNA-directed RNA polymerase sigma subunit (sigma70/sigma32)